MTNKKEDQQAEDFSPTVDELINELSSANSRLVLENIALRISISKMQQKLNSDNL